MAAQHDRGLIPPVTIVAHDIGPVGGMELQLSELIRGLLARDVDVTVISRTCDLEPHSRLNWVRVPTPARPFVLGYPLFFLVASLLVRRHRRGILHTTGANVGNRADVCTVHFCHRASWTGLPPVRRTWLYRANAAVSIPLKRLGERLLFRRSRCHRFAAVSRGLAIELGEIYPAIAGSIVQIPNGVDTERFRPDPRGRAAVRSSLGLSDSEFAVLFVGGLWDHKGLEVALRALADVDDARLVVLGAGDVPRYSEIAAKIGVASRVLFVGRQDDSERYFAAADVFVLPSVYETFSLVAHEAAASGLPLLATRVHGVDDLLVDGENGWFITRDPADLAARLRELRDDPDRRLCFGAAARSASERYSWERMTSSYVGVYEATPA